MKDKLNTFRLAFSLFFFLIPFSFTGCGYTFQGSGSNLPKDVKNIFIPLVKNNTAEANLDRILTESLKDQFDKFGVFNLVDSVNEADAIVNCTILSIDRGNRATTSGVDSSLQVQSSLNVAVEIKRPAGQVLWSNSRLVATSSYGATQGAVITNSADFVGSGLGSSDLSQLNSREVSRSQEGQVLENLSTTLARQIYNDAILPDF